MPTEEYNSGRPHQVVPQGVLALMPPLKILVTTVGAALLVWGLLFAYLSSPAWAADITVNTTADELNDDGDCSLREAVAAANTNAAVDVCAAGSAEALDTIQFAVGRGQTITLDSGLGVLLITDGAGLTINGQTKNITISGKDTSQVFRVEPAAVFNLSKLTVADGNFFLGAGLFNNGGTVKVSNSTFSGNSASEGAGAAIANGNSILLGSVNGTLKVSNSTFSGNSASGGAGGAIENDGGDTLTVTNSTFSENSAANGGAIRNSGTMTVTNSTFSGNSGPAGGGIFNAIGGSLKVSNSTFSGNSAASLGGAIFNDCCGGTMTVTNSTFSGNSAGEVGGAIENDGTLKASNSTFSGNSAEDAGGAIFADSDGTLTVSNSTFSGNSAAGSGFFGNSAGDAGGGIFVEFSGATLKNTIIANSTQGGDCTTGLGGTVNDRGYNLIEDGSCLTAASSRSGDPLLGALANNGGPTQTMALQEGSKAIDKGNSSGATTDQRGLPRPADFVDITNRGDGSDVGAYEVQP